MNALHYPLKPGDHFKPGAVTYLILELYSNEGSRSLTYLAEEIDTNRRAKVVIKLPKLDLRRSQEDIKARITSLVDDVNREHNAWERMLKTQNEELSRRIADVFESGTYRFYIDELGGTQLVPYIVQEFITGETLKTWCQKHFSRNKFFSGISSAEKWFEVAKEITKTIALVHQERVVHSDIWPPNIIMRSDAINDYIPVLIDFGQAWLLESQFTQAGQSGGYEYYAPERRVSGNVWYAPADLFSLGGILFYLATGDDPISVSLDNNGREEYFKSNTDIKQEIAAAIRYKNPDLYRENPGIVVIIQYCLRPRVNERAPYAEAVLEIIDLFQNAFQRKENLSSQLTGQDIEIVQKKLGEIKDIVNKGSGGIFPEILLHDIRRLEQRTRDLITRTCSITSDRETIVNTMLACLSTLSEDDQCFALTTSIFWARQNFGTDGRILTMLKMAGIKRINVRWVTLMRNSDIELNDIKKAVHANQRAINEVKTMGVDVADKTLDGSGYFMGYHHISDEEFSQLTRGAKTFIVLSPRNRSKTLIAPAYTRTGSEGNLAIVRLWDSPKRWEEFQKDLSKYLDHAKSFLDYPFQL